MHSPFSPQPTQLKPYFTTQLSSIIQSSSSSYNLFRPVDNGQSEQNGVGEAGGDLQQELLLHEPHRQIALLWLRGEPDGVRAGWDLPGTWGGAGAVEARVQPHGPRGFHWRWVRWRGQRSHEPPPQEVPQAHAQDGRGSLGLTQLLHSFLNKKKYNVLLFSFFFYVLCWTWECGIN